jgi:hypothetical protein
MFLQAVVFQISAMAKTTQRAHEVTLKMLSHDLVNGNVLHAHLRCKVTINRDPTGDAPARTAGKVAIYRNFRLRIISPEETRRTSRPKKLCVKIHNSRI